MKPRPHVGFTAITGGRPARVTWPDLDRDAGTQWLRPGDGIRFDLLFGGSVNDGLHSRDLSGRRDVGGNLLFHMGVELGYQIDRVWSVSLFLDHDSNGGTAKQNDGLNSLGLRLGFAL